VKNSSISKIVFVILFRYPTEKAYGVTIGNTASHLTDIGAPTEIWAMGGIDSDDFGNKIKLLSAQRVLPKYLSSINFFQKINFQANRFIGIIKFVQMIKKEKNTVFICREPILALIGSVVSRSNKFIIEIHHLSKPYWKYRFYSFYDGFKLALISEYQADLIYRNSKRRNLMTLKMAFPKDKIKHSVSVRNKNSQITIGYLGKLKSSGYDNNLMETIAELQPLLSEDKNFVVKIVGIESNLIEEFNKSISKLGLTYGKVTVLEHLSHELALQQLQTFDFGLIPYMESSYNNQRFPIKLVEYAAAGVPILINDIKPFRSLIPESCCIFYSRKPGEGIVDLILKFSYDSSKLLKLRRNASDWASELTYENRARSILSAFSI